MRNVIYELAEIAHNGKSTTSGFLAEESSDDFLKAPPPLDNFSICFAQSTAFGTLLDRHTIDFTNIVCD